MKKVIRVLIIGIVFAALIGGYYFYLTTRNGSGAQNETAKQTEVQKLLDEDLINNYPTTPRSVIKMYNRFLKCMYNEKYSDNEFLQMIKNQKELLDSELAAHNPEPQYTESMRKDVKQCKEEERTIRNATVCSGNEVIYKKTKKGECAYVTCTYFMKVGSNYQTTNQRYVLRKDDAGKWKILVYYLIRGEQ
ncbi:MAG: hypothetical protein E7277_09855 [Lachnospiraceae bacterium]|jgi:uncharacterized membrane-anchored protein|nr:hypothetical protein [Lachnospiraceae bacterium]